MNVIHDIGGGIAQPDPFAAFCNAAAFGCVAAANDNLSFALVRRRPAKFFGGERAHSTVSESTLCADHQISTGEFRDAGKVFQKPGKCRHERCA